MTDKKLPHEWVTSRLGHGEWQCIHCRATNREIAVVGDPNHCPTREANENVMTLDDVKDTLRKSGFKLKEDE